MQGGFRMGYKRKKETQRRQVARWREKHRKEYNEYQKEYKRKLRARIDSDRGRDKEDI
jgi:hypothetical protein